MLVFKVATSNMVSSALPAHFFFFKKNVFSLNDHLPCLSAELHGKMLPSSGIPSASVSGSWGGPESREGQAKGIQAGV